MSFGFLNAVMLLGLAGAALPVLVHLLSRRNYDVVAWGAMQFLELGRRTRRRIRLEELLLLLLRIGLVCLLAFALARPWMKGGLFSRLTRSTPRDIAVVIDGSYSMGLEANAVTPHAAAIQWTHELLELLGGDDTVTLIDARDRTRLLTERPTSDMSEVRSLLNGLAQPSGTSSLPQAGVRAIQALANGEHLDRELIILSDGQSFAWSPASGAAWRQFDETLRQSSLPPRVWAVDVAGPAPDPTVNFTVERLKLSRELTVPGFPLRVETTIRQWGGSATRREVSFAVNGRRLSEKTVMANLPSDGEAHLTFEHRFDKVGSYLVSVMLEPDVLPGDNRSDAAVVVENGIPVLLVDGDRHRDPTLCETFFLSAALTPAQSDAPWVMARVIEPGQLSEQAVDGQRAVVLANVARLSAQQIDLLREFVAAGGGLVVAPGELVDAEACNRDLYADGRGLLPARFDVVRDERDYRLGDVNLAPDSLEDSWLARFRPGSGVDLLEARFAHWWRMVPADGPEADKPVVAARFDTGDPFLVSREFGEGTVIQLAAPLDGDWSTLPSKNDFVPFVHELVFHLAARRAGRNVEVGMPLVLDAGPGESDVTVHVLTPEGRTVPAEPLTAGSRTGLGLREAIFPGVYRFERTGGSTADAEYFVVQSDRRESNLTPLSPADRAKLVENDRLQFVASVDDIVAAMADDQVATELWRMLLFAVLALLIVEVLLTRRLVQGGHEAVEDTPRP